MKRSITRRTILRGMGGAMMLPWLEEMSRSAATTSRPPIRSGFFYLPNGVVPEAWFPQQEQLDYTLSPSLAPLEPVRGDTIVFSGLDRVFGGGTDVHAQCGSCWLTSSPPDDKPDGMYPINRTLDQILAAKHGSTNLFPSLELTCNSFSDNKESRYFRTISWYAPGAAAAAENDPRVLYRKLFGRDVSDPMQRSILDLVREDAQDLRRTIGQLDRERIDEYFDSVRSIEQQLDRMDRRAREQHDIPLAEPADIPDERSQYIRMMGDLIALAFQQDLTRVVTMMFGPERWNTPQHYDGVFDKPQVHHSLTHKMGEPTRSPKNISLESLSGQEREARRKVALIDRFRVEQFAYLVAKLKGIPEADGTLLDHCMLTLGAGLGNGNRHNYDHLPTVVAGSAGGAFRMGRHIRCPDGTPLANLWLTQLRTVGSDLDQYADSTGALDLS